MNRGAYKSANWFEAWDDDVWLGPPCKTYSCCESVAGSEEPVASPPDTVFCPVLLFLKVEPLPVSASVTTLYLSILVIPLCADTVVAVVTVTGANVEPADDWV